MLSTACWIVGIAHAASDPPAVTPGEHRGYADGLGLAGYQLDLADAAFDSYCEDREEVSSVHEVLREWGRGLDLTIYRAYDPALEAQRAADSTRWSRERSRLSRDLDNRYFGDLAAIDGVDPSTVERLEQWRFINWRFAATSQCPRPCASIVRGFDLESVEEAVFGHGEAPPAAYVERREAFRKELYSTALQFDAAALAWESEGAGLIGRIRDAVTAGRRNDVSKLADQYVETQVNVIETAIAARRRQERFVREAATLLESPAAGKLEDLCESALYPTLGRLKREMERTRKASELADLTPSQRSAVSDHASRLSTLLERSRASLQRATSALLNPNDHEARIGSQIEGQIAYLEGRVEPSESSTSGISSEWSQVERRIQQEVDRASETLGGILTPSQRRKVDS